MCLSGGEDANLHKPLLPLQYYYSSTRSWAFNLCANFSSKLSNQQKLISVCVPYVSIGWRFLDRREHDVLLYSIRKCHRLFSVSGLEDRNTSFSNKTVDCMKEVPLFKATDSRESICHYPVITTCGHWGHCSAEVIKVITSCCVLLRDYKVSTALFLWREFNLLP